MRIEITVPVRVADVAARDLMSRGGSVTDKKDVDVILRPIGRSARRDDQAH